MKSPIDDLTLTQKQSLSEELQASLQHDKLPEQFRQREAKLDRLRVCVHWGGNEVARHGQSAGLRRFRCRSASCGRTFHALIGTLLAGLKHKSKWSMFEECLRDRLTLHQSAKRCGISYRTAVLWRFRFLDRKREEASLTGIMEMDETCFLESCKGDRSLKECRDPQKRGGHRGHRGLSPEQRPVLTAVSREGLTYAESLASTAAADIVSVMSEWLAEDCAIVTYGHPSYRVASRSLNGHQETLRVRQWEFSTRKLASEHREPRHMTMKRMLNHHHRGVSTRYLDSYIRWLMNSEFKADRTSPTDFLSCHLEDRAVHI